MENTPCVNRQFRPIPHLTLLDRSAIIRVSILLGYSVTVARLTLNQLVGVQIPVPQYFSCSVKNAEQVNSPNPVIPLTPIMSSRPLSYKRSDSTTTPRENHSFWFTIEPVCFFL